MAMQIARRRSRCWRPLALDAERSCSTAGLRVRPCSTAPRAPRLAPERSAAVRGPATWTAAGRLLLGPCARDRSGASTSAIAASALAAAVAAATAGCSARCEDQQSGASSLNAAASKRSPPGTPVGESEEFVESQRHLLLPSPHNPKPTKVPPPIEGLSGHHLRHRIVTSVVGLPLRGQAYIAHRLRHYLDFFHGAHTELFNVNEFLGKNGDEDLLEALRAHFDDPAHGMAKHAIIYTTNAALAADSQWSGHSKSRRRWIYNALQAELKAELLLVEVQVNDQDHHHDLSYVRQHPMSQELETLQSLIETYRQRYVTIQADGSEDDMSYIKVVDYNKKVVTNLMMQTFLGSRVARFLGNVHPYKHSIVLCMSGESEYNAADKIGGDSRLSARGEEYALRLAEFADYVVCKEARSFAFVSIPAAEVKDLDERLESAQYSEGVYAKGAWDNSHLKEGDIYGRVREGMRLVRLKPDGAEQFVDAPSTVAGVIRIANTGRPVTLVFTDPAAAEGEDKECCRLWTSAMLRAKQTCGHFKRPIMDVGNGKVWEQLGLREYRNLNHQYAGEYEGLTNEEIAERVPEEAELRRQDKLGYRYPRGESYYDVIARLDDAIQSLESYQEPIVIVAHLPVLRLLYAYITGLPRDHAPDLQISPHSVIHLTYDGASHVWEQRFTVGPEVVNSSSYGAFR